jgi:hypothetical protein
MASTDQAQDSSAKHLVLVKTQVADIHMAATDRTPIQNSLVSEILMTVDQKGIITKGIIIITVEIITTVIITASGLAMVSYIQSGFRTN